MKNYSCLRLFELLRLCENFHELDRKDQELKIIDCYLEKFDREGVHIAPRAPPKEVMYRYP